MLEEQSSYVKAMHKWSTFSTNNSFPCQLMNNPF
jgi:hypothetical protein